MPHSAPNDRLSRLINSVCQIWEEEASETEGKLVTLANRIIADNEHEKMRMQHSFKSMMNMKNSEIGALSQELRKLNFALEQEAKENMENKRKIRALTMELDALKNGRNKEDNGDDNEDSPTFEDDVSSLHSASTTGGGGGGGSVTSNSARYSTTSGGGGDDRDPMDRSMHGNNPRNYDPHPQHSPPQHQYHQGQHQGMFSSRSPGPPGGGKGQNHHYQQQQQSGFYQNKLPPQQHQQSPRFYPPSQHFGGGGGERGGGEFYPQRQQQGLPSGRYFSSGAPHPPNLPDHGRDQNNNHSSNSSNSNNSSNSSNNFSNSNPYNNQQNQSNTINFNAPNTGHDRGGAGNSEPHAWESLMDDYGDREASLISMLDDREECPHPGGMGGISSLSLSDGPPGFHSAPTSPPGFELEESHPPLGFTSSSLGPSSSENNSGEGMGEGERGGGGEGDNTEQMLNHIRLQSKSSKLDASPVSQQR